MNVRAKIPFIVRVPQILITGKVRFTIFLQTIFQIIVDGMVFTILHPILISTHSAFHSLLTFLANPDCVSNSATVSHFLESCLALFANSN